MRETEFIKQISSFYDCEMRDILLKFLLYFNVFENKFLCGESENSDNLRKIISNNSINIESTHQIYDFFVERYVQNGIINGCFADLFYLRENGKYRDEETRTKIIENLKSNTSDKVTKTFTSLVIAYRFRNNLYHGNKSILHLDSYKECFNETNYFMESIIDSFNTDINGGTVCHD